MLTITIPAVEYYDNVLEEFVYTDVAELQLEHSLMALSKWEAFYKKPFLDTVKKTSEETLGYVRMMTLTPNVPPEVYDRLSDANLTLINEYIGDKMSATWFNEKPAGKKEIITSEIIYFWMVSLNIPFECQHWHLNRLITLVKVCNEKNSPPKKTTAINRQEALTARQQLNAQRKAELKTTG